MIPPLGIRKKHPSSVSNFTQQLSIDGKHFDLKFGGWHQKNSEIATIRTAYLWAFSELGYSFILNPSLVYIRSQIHNPDENIIPTNCVLSGDIPDELLGLNIIKYPAQARSFFVVFDTTIQGHTTRYGVPLPGDSNPGLNIYDYFDHIQGQQVEFDCWKIEPLDINKHPLRAMNIWNDVVNLPRQ